MILNIFLIVIGFLTSVIGIWNIFIGSYIWGTLFGLGGIWSIWLGTLYTIQDRDEDQRKKAQALKENSVPETYSIPIDDGILTEDLFNISDETHQLIQSNNSQTQYENNEINPTNQKVIRLDEFMESPSDVTLKVIVPDEDRNSITQNLNTVVQETEDLTELSKKISE